MARVRTVIIPEFLESRGTAAFAGLLGLLITLWMANSAWTLGVDIFSKIGPLDCVVLLVKTCVALLCACGTIAKLKTALGFTSPIELHPTTPLPPLRRRENSVRQSTLDQRTGVRGAAAA